MDLINELTDEWINGRINGIDDQKYDERLMND